MALPPLHLKLNAGQASGNASGTAATGAFTIPQPTLADHLFQLAPVVLLAGVAWLVLRKK